MKALRQIEYSQPLAVCDVAVPQIQPGQAIVNILAANIISYMKDIYNGNRKYPYPTPLTIGSSAVARIHELGPDCTFLQKGDLVLIDITYRSRDNPNDTILSALHEGFTPGSKKLMSYWRDGTFAEYTAVPVENCHRLNDKLLLGDVADGGLGYTVPNLLSVPMLLVPYGGLTSINLRPSETIIIAPATGPFGTGAVHVALSLGARVIAMGRNTSSLSLISSTFGPHFPLGRLLTVPITNNSDQEISALKSAAGHFPIDAYLDISPPQAAGSTHLKSAIMSLRNDARISLMGGLPDSGVEIPHMRIMHGNMTVKGKWMTERHDIGDFIRMVEFGTVKLGIGRDNEDGRYKDFQLEEWKEAFDWAEEHTGLSGGAYFKVASEDI